MYYFHNHKVSLLLLLCVLFLSVQSIPPKTAARSIPQHMYVEEEQRSKLRGSLKLEVYGSKPRIDYGSWAFHPFCHWERCKLGRAYYRRPNAASPPYPPLSPTPTSTPNHY
ncbi:hypothetical protein LOK49_LG10G02651 [Camellia lanceoleosa]|uniref:Uncharacterized protein n=1 Tax=Camellia lanceoleosa TaxID=1840588 RepID=A0ACC0G901_9ERIC|nr:hypothetical protein LOK49_LG10G02651 [Camellia lanceoleosa]